MNDTAKRITLAGWDERYAELRAAGLSRQKIASVRSIAAAFSDGTLSNRQLRRMEDDAVVAAVTQLRGVGEWTAHMLLMFSLSRPDVLPVGDYGVRKGAMTLYGLDELPKPAELQGLAESWRPYRSVAAWYLWRVEDLAEA
jgi:3-methyladenine DNA glycosylase/8-oxoguanine DNA glycosylase